MKLVLIDRDSVLRQAGIGGALSSDDWDEVPGSVAAIVRLTRAGYRSLVIARPYVGRSIQALHDVHEKMLKLVSEGGGSLDGVAFPTRTEKGNDSTAGLFEKIAQRYRIATQDMVLFTQSEAYADAARSLGVDVVMLDAASGGLARAIDEQLNGGS